MVLTEKRPRYSSRNLTANASIFTQTENKINLLNFEPIKS